MPDSSPRRLVVELPLPPKECSPNYHTESKHKSIQKSKRVKVYRDQCAVLVAAAMRGAGIREAFRTPVKVTYEYYLYRAKMQNLAAYVLGKISYYPRDEQNGQGGAKPAVDSLQDAGLIPNDSAKFVKSGPCHLYSTKKKHQGRAALVLTIEEVTE